MGAVLYVMIMSDVYFRSVASDSKLSSVKHCIILTVGGVFVLLVIGFPHCLFVICIS